MFVTCYQNIGVGYNPQNQIILARITNAHINQLFFIVKSTNLAMKNDRKEGRQHETVLLINFTVTQAQFSQ